MGLAVHHIENNSGWNAILADEFKSDYMRDLNEFLMAEEQAGKAIFPSHENRFRALDLTPLENVKIVILGQDPYHGAGQAHGLSFSVQQGVRIAPSLRNIYKELHSDIGMDIPDHGFLEGWAKQGVLLLNTCLSVEESNAGSHQGKGWERFTDSVIAAVNDLESPVVFMLWGAYAQKKADMIDSEKHCILQTTHPSPLSAHRGFLGCKHFSKANEFLNNNGITPIEWGAL